MGPRTDTGASRTLTGCYMALTDVGLGLALQMATTIAQNSVDLRDMGSASAPTNLFLTAAVLCAAGFLAAILVQEVPLRGKPAASVRPAAHADTHDSPSPAGR
ncbi:hypothetical protein [Streptomyces sp. NPDC047043]|uniref:hypothetical protein n=1 Tax=Streptomyces sp. NPDC047043 TaxID=3154497 RepID=UPI0033CB242D